VPNDLLTKIRLL
jgi:hypothetical protein